VENLRNKIQTVFIQRAPNSLTLTNLSALLGGEDLHALSQELQRMVAERVLVERTSARNKDYLLASYNGIPVREYVTVGGVKVPRLLQGDTARPEDLNIYFEVVAQRLVAIDAESEKRIDERLKGYWGNIVTLFGAFIGVFSLIVAFIKPIPIGPDATFVSVLALTAAQLIPLALVLGAFVWLLRVLFK
jgi:hypothetical protein